MRFFSDNAAPVHPAVLQALADADHIDTAYAGDARSRALDARFSELFERPVAALWIATGTAANALALAALCPSYGGILCHRDSHINNDECGAPEFYTGGGKLFACGVDGAIDGAKLTPASVRAVADAIADDVHRIQPHALSITNATEYGRVYRPGEVAALGALAKERGWGFHMDGARFANAIDFLDCSPAELTWKAGVDILSFGFVKNGGLSSEMLIFFDPEAQADRIDATLRRRKRGGHLLSKGRYLAAEVHALLDEDRWRATARTANQAAATLAAAAGDRLLQPVEVNELFLRAAPAEAARLRAQGFDFYDWAEGEIRLVVHWASPAAEVEALAKALASV